MLVLLENKVWGCSCCLAFTDPRKRDHHGTDLNIRRLVLAPKFEILVVIYHGWQLSPCKHASPSPRPELCKISLYSCTGFHPKPVGPVIDSCGWADAKYRSNLQDLGVVGPANYVVTTAKVLLWSGREWACHCLWMSCCLLQFGVWWHLAHPSKTHLVIEDIFLWCQQWCLQDLQTGRNSFLIGPFFSLSLHCEVLFNLGFVVFYRNSSHGVIYHCSVTPGRNHHPSCHLTTTHSR